jgi:hypothetical protein
MKRIDKRYQKYLADLGLYVGRVDGLHGPATDAAVRKFQSMNGLKADGIVGKKTSAEFEEHLAKNPDRTEPNPRIPDRKQTHPYTRWPKERMSDLQRFYGKVGRNQVKIDLPYDMVLAWDTKKSLSGISCHSKVAKSLQGVLETVRDEYSAEEIRQHGFNLFGGCLNVRKIRGGNRWSTHAWGIAIDFDPARNGLRTKWKDAYLSRPECAKFVQAFKDEGWYSLGLERNYDAMHFQACYR